MNRAVSAATLLILVVGNAAVFAGSCPPGTAQYRLTFNAVWSQATHPTNFPSSPHFSGLVGGVHSEAVSFWDVGQQASPGIERMAELGSKTVLINEVNAAITAGTAESVISGNGIAVSPGSVSVDFSVSQAFPRVTIVTMLAPSPDWFVGVSGVPLFEDGNWVESLTIQVYSIDAGTDSGASYSSSNIDTNPAEPIFEIIGDPFLNGNELGAVGSFGFARLSATCSDSDADGLADDVDNCLLVANAGQHDTDGDSIGNACDPDLAPVNNDCVVNFLDLNAMKAAFFSQSGGSGWNPDADFTDDDRVNFADLTVMQERFFAAPGPSAAGCN